MSINDDFAIEIFRQGGEGVPDVRSFELYRPYGNISRDYYLNDLPKPESKKKK